MSFPTQGIRSIRKPVEQELKLPVGPSVGIPDLRHVVDKPFAKGRVIREIPVLRPDKAPQPLKALVGMNPQYRGDRIGGIGGSRAVDSDVVETDFNKNIIELEGNKGKSNFTGNGTIFTMTFEALKNGESSVSLACKNGDSGNITNVAEEKVLVSFTPGTVTESAMLDETKNNYLFSG